MDRDVSRKILTLSVSFEPPKGGVAQVVSVYSRMFPVFNHVSTTCVGSRLDKLVTLVLALIKVILCCTAKDIEVVHVHGASHTSFFRKRVFIQIAKFFRKKVVYHIHGAEFKDFVKRNESIVRATMRKVDVVVALSGSWKDYFESAFGHPNVVVIENVVSLPEELLVEKSDVVRYLFLGELGQRKGIYDLLNAVSAIRQQLIGKAIFHIGGGGEASEVQSRISQLGIDEIVVLEGWVAGKRKIELLNLADVYILPSYNEGLPVSVLEAMSYGLPVISTPVGGIPEVVENGQNGILVTPGDSNALQAAILRMLGDEAFRRQAKDKSLARVAPYYPDAVSSKLEQMYRSLLMVGAR